MDEVRKKYGVQNFRVLMRDWQDEVNRPVETVAGAQKASGEE
jgi:hypothetical protein